MRGSAILARSGKRAATGACARPRHIGRNDRRMPRSRTKNGLASDRVARRSCWKKRRDICRLTNRPRRFISCCLMLRRQGCSRRLGSGRRNGTRSQQTHSANLCGSRALFLTRSQLQFGMLTPARKDISRDLIRGHGYGIGLGRGRSFRRGRGLFWSGDGLEDERLGENGFEEMLGVGKADGGFGGIGESGDAEDKSIDGFFGAEADGGFDSGFAQSASEAEYARESTNEKLLLFGKFGESVFEFWFGSALKANGPGEDIPLVGGPIRR